jgi:TonB family protein
MLDKRIAFAALALGIVGLFTAGGLVVGSILGLVLAVVALIQARREPSRFGGRDVAWAALAANLFALASVAPMALLAVTVHHSYRLSADDTLPTPVGLADDEPLELPPPPPPPLPAPATTKDELEPVRIGGAIREPHKVKNVAPVYPDIARLARVQGTVVLEAVIDPRGNVTSVRVLRGAPLLDAAAMEAVRQWRYTPTLLEGRPVPVIMTITVNFRLS